MKLKLIVVFFLSTMVLLAVSETMNSEKNIMIVRMVVFGLLALFSGFKFEQNFGASTYNTRRLTQRGQGSFINTITTWVMIPIWFIIFVFSLQVIMERQTSVYQIFMTYFDKIIN